MHKIYKSNLFFHLRNLWNLKSFIVKRNKTTDWHHTFCHSQKINGNKWKKIFFSVQGVYLQIYTHAYAAVLCACTSFWGNLTLTGSGIRDLTWASEVMSGHCPLACLWWHRAHTLARWLCWRRSKRNCHLERLVTGGRSKVRSGS